MKPVMQTMFGASWQDDDCGDCTQAAVASVLDLPLTEVPHFVKDGGADEGGWWQCLADFLLARDLYPIAFDAATMPDNIHGVGIPCGYHLIAGETARGRGHMVVGQNGKVIHDPHPSGVGLEKITDCIIFVACLNGSRSE